MAYLGWFRYDGIELSNAARFDAYATANGLSFFHERHGLGDLEAGLSLIPEGMDGPYVDPATDNAPWYDPSAPETAEFLGFYVLSAANLENGQVARDVTESVRDGGYASVPRVATRQVVFRGILAGTTRAGARAGLGWLKTLLAQGDVCGVSTGGSVCGPDELSFFDARPEDCPPLPSCYHAGWRSLVGVTLLEGPTVLQERSKDCWAFIDVEFTLVAQNPYILRYPHTPALVATDTSYADYLNPTYFPVQTYAGLKSQPPVKTYAGLSEYLWNAKTGSTGTSASEVLPEYDKTNFQDPLCPVPPPFPGAPQNDITCRVYHAGPWTRKVFVLDSGPLPAWAEAVPRVALTNLSPTNHISDLRVRFVPPTAIPETGHREEFYVTSLPPQSTMTICGVMDAITLHVEGHTGSAEHLVYSNITGSIVGTVRADPYRFPTLQCDGEWKMVVDCSEITDWDDVSVSLRVVGREA